MKKIMFLILGVLFSNIMNAQNEKIDLVFESVIGSDYHYSSLSDAEFAVLGDSVMIFKMDGELWHSDGTAEGTYLIKDIRPSVDYFGDPQSSFPGNFITYKDYVYFSAHDDTNGTELWRTDGTTDGTELVKDIFPGLTDGIGGSFCILNDELLFNGISSLNIGRELWKSNGTTEGTVLVKDIDPRADIGTDPQRFTTFKNKLYFTVEIDRKPQIWYTDGTEPGTKPLLTEPLAAPLKYITQLTATDDYLFFIGYSESTHFEMYRTDGTPEGTILLKNIHPTYSSIQSDDDIIVFNNELFFPADNDTLGIELWKSDGTPEGTVMVKDIVTGSEGSYPTRFCIYNNKLYFAGINSTYGSRIIMYTDGTADGTGVVNDPDQTYDFMSHPIVAHNRLFFDAEDSNRDHKLMSIDATHKVAVHEGNDFLYDDGIFGVPFVFKEQMFMIANLKANTGLELYRVIQGDVNTSQEKQRTAEPVLCCYPNPTSGKVQVLSNQSIVCIEIYSANGQRISTVANKNNIDLSAYRQGMYLLRIADITGNVSTTLVLKK
jgi:ELWxxDGT repeat protein